MSSATIDETQSFAGALGKELGIGEVRSGSWFSKLVMLYLRHHQARVGPSGHLDGEARAARARRAIRRACAKSTVTGVASGATSTGAALLTLHTHGVGAIVGVPAAAAGLVGEVLYRAVVHVDLTCELADLYGIHFDPDQPDDLLRLYSLIFGEDPPPAEGAQGLMDRVLRLGGDDVGLKIGTRLVSQALKRSAVPVMGVVTSGLSNLRLTRQLGDTVLRYIRYQRALQDLLAENLDASGPHADLLIEGVWFALTADGQISTAEAAVLAWLVRQRPPLERAALGKLFVEDDEAWMRRLGEAPAELRAGLYHALEVAASVDRAAQLPERRLLRRAARALGQEFDGARLDALARRLDGMH